MLVIRDEALAAKYVANWQAHVKHSEVYEGCQEAATPSEKPVRKRKAA